jgi:hypothetical protein
MRYSVVQNIKQLYIHLDKSATHQMKKEWNYSSIYDNENNAVIEKADEGYSIIIHYKQHNRHNDFLKSNNFHSLNKDPTNSFQKSIRHFPHTNTSLIRKEHKWKFINLNPIPTNLRGVIKMHKPNFPIRPVVN